jgi:hypothetical protein
MDIVLIDGHDIIVPINAFLDYSVKNGTALNPVLHKIGASYGVIKLLSDPPHWSSDGH